MLRSNHCLLLSISGIFGFRLITKVMTSLPSDAVMAPAAADSASMILSLRIKTRK